MFRDDDGKPKKLWALSEKGDYSEMRTPDQIRATALYNEGKIWRFYNPDMGWSPPELGTGLDPIRKRLSLKPLQRYCAGANPR